jgi:hypothetical protein
MKKIEPYSLKNEQTEVERLNLLLALNPSRTNFLQLSKEIIRLLDWDFIFATHYERKKKLGACL